MSTSNPFGNLFPQVPEPPVRVSTRTLRAALDATLMSYTRIELEVVLAEELKLDWTDPGTTPDDSSYSKRELIWAYTPRWELPRLVGLARRVVTELDRSAPGLVALLEEYDRGGGVGTPAKNLIFAANGPKPELVLRDAVNNDIEIVRNAEFCLVYDRPVPADGLRLSHLIDWWREGEALPTSVTDRDVGLLFHARLRASVAENPVEAKVFDTYAARYRDAFDTPVLIPQVYLHYDPHTQRDRKAWGEEQGPLARQRMDFLILFSDRHRVVLEVDGRQHYATPDGVASPTLYGQMVAEDRRLRLAGYEVYRFGGAEMMANDATEMLTAFFDQLASRMS